MFWTCTKCGRNAANAVTKCRKCGAMKPKLGIITEDSQGKPRMTPLKDLEAQGKIQHQKNERKKHAKLPDPEEGKFFVSTLKRKGE